MRRLACVAATALDGDEQLLLLVGVVHQHDLVEQLDHGGGLAARALHRLGEFRHFGEVVQAPQDAVVRTAELADGRLQFRPGRGRGTLFHGVLLRCCELWLPVWGRGREGS
nr:hypothetical protein [Ramlibacter montanisoli]